MVANTVSIETLRQSFAEAEETGEFTVMPPVHPGEILREDYMIPAGLTAGAVARALNLPRSRIERIVREEIGISTDTALRLARLFRTTPQLWLNLQTQFEMETLDREIGQELSAIEPVPETQAEAA